VSNGYLGVKQESDHSTPSGFEVKNNGFTATIQYVYMALGLITYAQRQFLLELFGPHGGG
jgi:hypothetical protein